MVLIYLNTGECIEVQDAVKAELRNDNFVCLDVLGHTTATFAAGDVESFTANEQMAESFKEEVCEDLTVINEGEVVKEPDPA